MLSQPLTIDNRSVSAVTALHRGASGIRVEVWLCRSLCWGPEEGRLTPYRTRVNDIPPATPKLPTLAWNEQSTTSFTDDASSLEWHLCSQPLPQKGGDGGRGGRRLPHPDPRHRGSATGAGPAWLYLMPTCRPSSGEEASAERRVGSSSSPVPTGRSDRARGNI